MADLLRRRGRKTEAARNAADPFDPRWYLASYPDVAASGLDPLVHYLRYGQYEGRAPNETIFRTFAGSIPTGKVSLCRTASPVVSIIIPVHNQWPCTLWCLRSIRAQGDDVPYEVILADDASTDETLQAQQQAEPLTVVRTPGEPLGFLRNCNQAAQRARAEYLLLLNNDTLLQPGCLSQLVATARRETSAGLIGCKLLTSDFRLQEAGGIVFQDGSAMNYGRGDRPEAAPYNHLRETDYCSGAAILVRRSLWEEIGGFDPRFAPAYYEDTDLAFEVRRRGYRVLYQPRAAVVHFEGVSHGTDLAAGIKRHQVLNQRRFADKWAGVLRQEQLPPGAPLPLARDRGQDRRRLLVIDWELPDPQRDSGSVRMVNLVRVLQKLGCRVTFLPAVLAAPPADLERLEQMGVFVPHRPDVESVKQFLAENGRFYDVVMISRVNTAEIALDLVRKYCPQAYLIFDTVDLHFLREERRAELENSDELRAMAARVRRQELQTIRRSDLTLVVSPVEVELLAREAPRARVEVVSNIHEVRPSSVPFARRRDLLFIGGFAHTPNVDAVKWLVGEIFPLVRRRLPGVNLHVLGSNTPPEIQALAAPDIRICGHVRDVDPYFQQCRLSVAPLRYGAGVKGKINLSMASGLPVVSTTIGCEGMSLRHGEQILIADDAATFASAIAELYTDEALWQRLVGGGLDNVRRQFSFEAAEATLARILPATSPRTAAA